MIVEDTKKVIDPKTGEVLKTQETRTPVTVTEQKTVEHDVNVKPGETKTTVELRGSPLDAWERRRACRSDDPLQQT